MAQKTSLTLSQYAQLIASMVNGNPQLTNVWVVAELSDLRVSRGHCYLELLEKDPQSGQPLARMRAMIWASVYQSVGRQFYQATGQALASGMKVMVCLSANFHPAYGLSASITGINPAYTLGEAIRLRNEIIARLQHEGIYDLNKQLPMPAVPQRVAVISGNGAAGFGDFVKIINEKKGNLRLEVQLFEAVVQGALTPQSVMAALDRIAQDLDRYDCVVITRGGGSTADLQSFDNYELAAHVAQFPLPIIVGIGHERDVTVLDYIANVRRATPTDCAEWLVRCGLEALGTLQQLAAMVQQAATARLAHQQRQLSYYQGLIPSLGKTRIARAMGVLDRIAAQLPAAAHRQVERASQQLTAMQQLVDVLSPQATLRRGYSITRTAAGATVRSAADAPEGTLVITTTAQGEFASIVTEG